MVSLTAAALINHLPQLPDTFEQFSAVQLTPAPLQERVGVRGIKQLPQSQRASEEFPISGVGVGHLPLATAP